jgi:polyhydroxyalkanoate synthesis regulator phasin
MEDSKAQDKILDLGKNIVKELELDPGVDTLAKWMAHYVAEKIVLAESLNGNKKKQAKAECFETISKLWEHRWSIPHNKPFLQDFESLFETLNKLNPIKDTPFFLSPQFLFEMEEEIKTSETIEIDSEPDDALDENLNPQAYLDSVLRVDKLARSLIADLLNQAVSRIDLSTEREETIRNSIDAIDYPESRIIRITSDYNKYSESQKEDIDETQNRISEMKRKIDELEELTSIVQSLASIYKNELSKIEL